MVGERRVDELAAARGQGDAPPPPVDAATTAGVTAKLALDSTPSGATVIGPDGKTLGTTPLKIEWPASKEPVVFTLKLKGYRDKKKSVVIDGNTATSCELTKLAVTPAPPKNGKKDPDVNGSGLERPE